jgi:hypothetical protein
MLGYRTVDGLITVELNEAALVKMIFREYLAGAGMISIMKRLIDMGAGTRFGGQWNDSTIRRILTNPMYVGDLCMQKTFVSDHLAKRRCVNGGELPMYVVENNHEPIIAREDFESVQKELAQRSACFAPTSRGKYPFTGLLVCDTCGKHYRRKITAAGTPYEKPVWICQTFNKYGKRACASKQIPESILTAEAQDVLSTMGKDVEDIKSHVARVVVLGENQLLFHMVNGEHVWRTWEDASRSDGWDDAKRQQASDRRKRSRMDNE